MNELINCKNIAMKFKLICLIAILYNLNTSVTAQEIGAN